VEHGYNVTPQVKVGPYSIDLVVDGEQDRHLAIELDGGKYHTYENNNIMFDSVIRQWKKL
jgi:very-short-patch-repair endonuclease